MLGHEDLSDIKQVKQAKHLKKLKQLKHQKQSKMYTDLFSEIIDLMMSGKSLTDIQEYSKLPEKAQTDLQNAILAHYLQPNSTDIHSAKQVTINNTQNINNNNIKNVQNNSIKPKFQLELRDFFKDDYEYVHIKNKEVFNDEFFEHKNFLTHILSNDVNKNIYFKNGYAYLFAGGQIIRIPNDKAGYILMEKMFSTMGSFLRSNALISADDYDHIIRFFSVEKLKYLNDTIYKSYDVKTRQYLPDAVSLRRTRDKYLNDVTESTNKFKERTKEIFQQKAPDSCPEQCQAQKIHIPGFIATRLRNQGFDDD
jgi:hypothetical protein